MSSPLAGMCGTLLGKMSERYGLVVFINDVQRQLIRNDAFCHEPQINPRAVHTI